MSVVGLFSDSEGDLKVLDRALRFLIAHGARRFMFAGNRYQDLDDWVQWKRDEARAASDYTDLDFLADVSGYLGETEQVDRPAAFGTAYELSRTASELSMLKDKTLRTPEKGSLAYQDPAIPSKAVDMLGEVLCCMVHDKNDLDKEDMTNALVLVHGKEPEPKVVQIGPRYFVTPGKLTGPNPSVGLLEVAPGGLRFSAFGLDGTALISGHPISAGGKKKISVK